MNNKEIKDAVFVLAAVVIFLLFLVAYLDDFEFGKFSMAFFIGALAGGIMSWRSIVKLCRELFKLQLR